MTHRSTAGVWVLGSYQTDFARNLTREGNGFHDLFTEVIDHTLDDAQLSTNDVEVLHVGNAFGQAFTGQAHLGAMPATVADGLWGLPATRHEAACASGSVATMAAMADLESGRYGCALVIGAEIEKSVAGDQAAHNLAGAAWVGHEGHDANFMWPYMFSELAAEYDRRYGVDPQHLHAIAEINVGNAKHNPKAQTRQWRYGPASFTDDDEHNPVVDGWTRRNDCSQVTDGGAGIVLASERWVRDHPQVLKTGRAARIIGWGHRTVGLPLAPKFERSRDTVVMPHVQQAVADALDRAGLNRIDEVDGVETHDCFAMSEYMAIDHLGLTEPGKNWQAIEDGTILRDGALPINPSGGLIGGGHPVGATGVRMLVDATRQVTGRAEDTQVDGASTFATLNIGGSTATTCSFVVASGDDTTR